MRPPPNGARALIVLAATLLCGCKVGIDAHPLNPTQAAALQTRDAPTAREDVEGFTSILVRVPIAASPDHVWAQLGEHYGDVHQWSGPIEASGFTEGHVVGAQGATRSCTLGPSSPIGKGESFNETIVAWDPARHYYAAAVNDGFFPLRRVVQEYWVQPGPDGVGASVTTQFHYDLAPLMGKGKGMRKKLKPQLVTSLLGLKHLIETGNGEEARDGDFLAGAYPSMFEVNGV
ncbi:MAG: SRPBCC family protein [Nannocystales bacterium]